MTFQHTTPPIPSSTERGGILLRHLVRAYRETTKEYRRALKSCRKRAKPGAVHRLRVTIRCVLACLDLLRAVQRKQPPVRKRLNHQLKLLGGVRDLQVQRRLIKSYREFAPAMRPLLHHLHKHEHRRVESLLDALSHEKVRNQLERWEVNPAGGTNKLPMRVRKVLERKMQRAFDPLVSILPDRAAPEKTRHHIRHLARDYCYALKLLPPCWRKGDSRRLLIQLALYRQLVGAMHDHSKLLRRVTRSAIKGSLSLTDAQAFAGMLRGRVDEITASCDGSERKIFHQAMLARRELRHAQPTSDARFPAAVPKGAPRFGVRRVGIESTMPSIDPDLKKTTRNADD